MYKILIKLNSSREIFQWYGVDGEVYSTTDLSELADKYRELLDTYPATAIIPVHEMDTEILVNISE